MKPFPYVLIRICGGPFENLEVLKANEAMRCVENIIDLKHEIRTTQQNLNDALYNVISTCTDSKLRLSLVNCKRDVFNGRPIPLKTYSHIIPDLPKEVKDELMTYKRIIDKSARLIKQGECKYLDETSTSRDILRGLCKEEILRKGLILSSQSLLKYGIPRYLSVNSRTLNKEEIQAERNILKYITRIYGKTSPFSTFTHLGIRPFTAESENEINRSNLVSNSLDRKDIIPEVRSHIRLNNELFIYLIGLLTRIPEVYRNLLIHPNPTLIQKDKNYIFLMNINNVESFQRISYNPVLELLLKVTTARKEGVIYGEVLKTIVDNGYIDASSNDIETYINQLIGYGFFEFNFNISGQDLDWDIHLREKLRAFSNNPPIIEELITTLKYIRGLTGEYNNATVERRLQIIEDAYLRIKTICLDLERQLGDSGTHQLQTSNDTYPAEVEEKQNPTTGNVFKREVIINFNLKPEKVFYEDTTTNNLPKYDEAQLKLLVASLHNLYYQTRRFDMYLDEHDKMLYYFNNKYGETSSADLLTFYEDYYRDFKLPEEKLKANRDNKQKNEEKEKADNAILDIDNIPRILERQKSNGKWLQVFAEIVNQQAIDSESEGIYLTLEQLKKANEIVPYEVNTDYRTSHDVFIQLFTEKQRDGSEKLMGVLSGRFFGFGKIISRFLYLFDDVVTKDLRECILSVNQGEIFIEGCDSAVFNANLHLPFMPFEIKLPNGQNSLPVDKQIPVTEFHVKVANNENQLELIHTPSGKRSYVFDVTLMSLNLRSQLFQLLEKFSLAELPTWWVIFNVLEKNAYNAENIKKVKVFPRIIYDDRIILERKSWHVPKELIPARKPQESEWSYFIRLNEWRLQWGMPEDVFIIVSGIRINAELSKSDKFISPDDRKPQYISFNNPLLVNLFEKSIDRVTNELIIIEMLPTFNQLLLINNKHYVTEFVIEWYTSNEEIK